MEIDELREERNGRTVPLQQFYEEYNKKNKNKCYGFVEGKDDPSYYRRIIDNNLSDNCSVTLYPCDGKKNVKYIYNQLDWRIYSKRRIVFFMDRDLSPVIEDKDIVYDTNVYITENYSIENDILCKETLCAVMQDILGFSSIKEEEKILISKLFIEQKTIFETLMVPIMSNIIFWKRYHILPANYNNLKIRDIVKITNGKVGYTKSEQEAIEILYKESGVEWRYYNKKNVNQIKIEIKKDKLEDKITRGKYFATFFILLSNSIRDDYENIGINKPNKRGRYLCDKDIFETIALRCRPPKSLKLFLKDTIMSYFNNLCANPTVE